MGKATIDAKIVGKWLGLTFKGPPMDLEDTFDYYFASPSSRVTRSALNTLWERRCRVCL